MISTKILKALENGAVLDDLSRRLSFGLELLDHLPLKKRMKEISLSTEDHYSYEDALYIINKSFLNLNKSI